MIRVENISSLDSFWVYFVDLFDSWRSKWNIGLLVRRRRSERLWVRVYYLHREVIWCFLRAQGSTQSSSSDDTGAVWAAAPQEESQCLVMGRLLVWFPWSACWSVLGQDTETQTTPGVKITPASRQHSCSKHCVLPATCCTSWRHLFTAHLSLQGVEVKSKVSEVFYTLYILQTFLFINNNYNNICSNWI